ncbi:hypothetical protein C5167_043303 [Papaver somniferum]|uniref:Exocyst complex component n=1 Tax=Papaver somniferum TaxID=3469 RepID=A0A4Y7L9A1_PAPSO|nr:exocyst complex component SEC15B-like [Papaver somniferum]RZC80735.1 hypothetical protein C5167_043303 [Papaver somniferum]
MSSSGRTKKTVNKDGDDDPNSEYNQEEQVISSAISNGEDLGPIIRKAFSNGKPDILLSSLKNFKKSKEYEIEEVCKIHYQDFITAVDELKDLLSDVDELKSSISSSNSILQSTALPLLNILDSFIESRNVYNNVHVALNSVQICIRLLELCSRVNFHLESNNFYLALKCIDLLENEFLDDGRTPSVTIRRMLEKQIPSMRLFIERKISKEFGDWLVDIRLVSRNLGQLAIGQASAGRQREEELRIKQRQAEEQSRLSLRDCVYALIEEEEEDESGDGVGYDGKEMLYSNGGSGMLGFDLTPLYRAYHIHQNLGLENRFKQYYFENRKLQLTSDFQVSSMTPFLESHQTFFAQIAGFFIVEDRILRTGGGLITKYEVENLWDTAVSKMCSVLEDQFSRMQTANHLLLIKDYVSLLGVTLCRYGYPVHALLDVIGKHRDKYHELLLSESKKLIGEALAADNFEQMMMRKEYEYSMNVLAFQIQTSEIMPAFPYIAPFSSTVPDCCRIVRSFIEDSVSFMSYGGQLEFYDVVKKHLDRLLTDVLDGSLLKLIKSPSVNGVSQAMLVAANMAVLERACDFFFRHAAQLSGIPLRMAERGRKQNPLNNARDAAEEVLSGLLKAKVDGFMILVENVNWVSEEVPHNGNEYVNEVIIYLETLVSTAQQILLVQVLKRVLKGVLSHISGKIVSILLSDSVKRFNISAITGIDVDVRLLESFADNLSHIFSDEDASQLKSALVESRQLMNLLLSSHPENFLNPVIRERSYNTLDYRKVISISEKLKDSSDSYFGSFGGRGTKQDPKKRSLDALVKRLKDVS